MEPGFFRAWLFLVQHVSWSSENFNSLLTVSSHFSPSRNFWQYFLEYLHILPQTLKERQAALGTVPQNSRLLFYIYFVPQDIREYQLGFNGIALWNLPVFRSPNKNYVESVRYFDSSNETKTSTHFASVLWFHRIYLFVTP